MSTLDNAREAWFLVQRGSDTLKVQGKDMLDKVKDGDIFFVQRGDKQFKFTTKRAEFPWEETVGWYHIKNVTGGELKLWPQNGNTTKMWDQDENPVTKLDDSTKEYFVSGVNSAREMNSFQGNAGINWDFGDRGDVHLIRRGEQFFKGCDAFNGNVDCFKDIPWKTMQEMFMGCKAFNQDISDWFGCGRVRNGFEQTKMFNGCAAFTGDLSSWCGVSDIDQAARDEVFAGSGIAGEPRKWINFDCRSKARSSGVPLGDGPYNDGYWDE